MLKEVIKRNGKVVKFTPKKIKIAIQKANDCVSVKDRVTDEDLDEIISSIKAIKEDRLHIEVIQDLVETKLMELKRFELAKKYITYRYLHKLRREMSHAEHEVIGLLNGKNKEVIDENSNKNSYANSTQRDLMAGEISKDIARKFILPDDIVKADRDEILHWHDMDYTAQNMVNCCLINIKNILDNGTVMSGVLIKSPHSFLTACSITAQVIANIASNQYGGQSVSIKHLGKYLKISEERYRLRNKKDWEDAGISYAEEQVDRVVENQLQRELEQGVQSIQYMIQTLMTTNGQAPFLTLFLHLDESDPYIDYTAKIILEIIKQRAEGVENKEGVKVTPAFPKLIYVLDENNCLRGGKYDYITREAAKCTIKRSYPDYMSAKKMREQFDGEVFSCMGCRSFLSPWKKTDWYVNMMGEPKSEIGKYLWEGRFNQGVVSLNLPQIAIIADKDMQKFWLLLEERLNLCYRALLFRHNLLKNTVSDTSPLHWQFGAISRYGVGEKINKLLEDGFSTLSLGYIGVYEMTYAMLGVSHTTEKGKEFALKVMNRLKTACETWKEQTGLGFGVYGTPSESLCYRFCRHDLEVYGSIPNVTDKGYYTNSYHIDVREEINAFDKFKFESEFQPLSSGGCISYVEIPNEEKNVKVIEKLITYIYDNVRYGEFNSKSDYCFVCGYDGQINLNEDNEWECPCCHNKDMKKMSITRRTCGYLGSNEWNWGKRKEIGSRVEHL